MNIRIILSLIAFTIIFGAFGQDNAAIDSLENVLKTAKADTTKVNCLNALSYQYGKISDFKMAIQYADSALDLATTLDYKKGIANSNKYIGNCCEIQGNFSKALEHFWASLRIYEEIGDKREIGFIYNNIGIIYWNMGSLPEALENTMTALNTFEEIGDKEGMASAYNSIGLIYLNMYNYSEAMKHYSAALKISEEIGNKKSIIISCNHIGHIHLIQGNYAEALEIFLTSLKICDEIGSRIDAAGCNNNIGCIYWEQGNYHEAIKYFQASLKITKEIGYDALTFYNYDCLADVTIALNNIQEARTYLDDRLAFSKERGNKRGIVSSYIKIGDLSQKQGNFQEARKYLDEGLALSKKIGNKDQIKTIYNHLSILDSAQGNYAQALEHYKIFTLYKDSLRNEENKKQTEQMLIQYEAEKKDREIELLNKDKELQEQKLERQTLIRNGMIAGVVLIVCVGLLLFRSFRLRNKLEKAQAIAQERHRISADLHDDIGSGLSRIMLLSELEKNEAKSTKTGNGVEKIATISNELAKSMDEIVWALNSDNDYVENLAAYIRRFAVEFFESSPVRLTINTPGKMDHIPISGERRRNIFYAVKEALNNIIKHAQATEAELGFKVKQNVLSVVINDNGKGFNKEELNKFGNGLKNMRKRMQSINGNLQIENRAGTKITLSVPV